MLNNVIFYGKIYEKPKVVRTFDEKEKIKIKIELLDTLEEKESSKKKIVECILPGYDSSKPNIYKKGNIVCIKGKLATNYYLEDNNKVKKNEIVSDKIIFLQEKAGNVKNYVNDLVLVGRVVGLPETKNNKKDDKMIKIVVAVSRNYKNEAGMYETDFIDCLLSHKLAETACKYLKSGDLIGIKGEITCDNKSKVLVNGSKITMISMNKEKENDEQTLNL